MKILIYDVQKNHAQTHPKSLLNTFTLLHEGISKASIWTVRICIVQAFFSCILLKVATVTVRQIIFGLEIYTETNV